MNQQQKCLNERVEAFQLARDYILESQPTISRDLARTMLDKAEAALKKAIECNDYAAAEGALRNVMLCRARIARHDFPNLYGPVEAATTEVA